MKRYNHGNKRSVLMGIVIPILLFFISMTATFAYFTATAEPGKVESQTAYLKINFSDNNFLANSQAITESVKLLPGDTLSASGTIVNESNVPAYAIVGFKIFAIKQGSSVVEILKDSYYSFDGANAIEIVKTGDTYTSAIALDAPNENKTNNCKKTFNLSHTFSFYDYGNEYKNATITYSVKAYAIQTSQIEDGSQATEILLDRFNTINQYQQVEYIESTGTQYIDTKFVPDQDTSVLIDYQLTEVTPSFIFGTRGHNDNDGYINSYTLNIASDTNRYVSFYNTYCDTSSLADTEKHIIYKNKNKLYIDNTLIATAVESDFTAESSLNLLACCHVGTNGYLPTKAKLYSFSIFDNTTLVKKLMPCYRVSDGEIGLLDIINNEFYTNSGTGEFLKGNNIQGT